MVEGDVTDVAGVGSDRIVHAELVSQRKGQVHIHWEMMGIV